ncbi:hypothetical protein SAMD00019534_109340 [Acytostelium subglobosum LB1]|uniref:hypothetical protein n=1 Tax=Acytostelium subglobosum LB1 TaxID=1410327 RepID=UPI000645202C|nr:hypothetical protein SAMD00019534_109340 [Acytostelium subglobosum LB1]GAM27758.1 hypothetical protein SAMD00019534_109340 [Acytostelium subglobosum LB1]|eukprot:XP_012749417.1 hypothetical protein SAMD00019534_109340 [Acytostelium subglobosum LB1]
MSSLRLNFDDELVELGGLKYNKVVVFNHFTTGRVKQIYDLIADRFDISRSSFELSVDDGFVILPEENIKVLNGIGVLEVKAIEQQQQTLKRKHRDEEQSNGQANTKRVKTNKKIKEVVHDEEDDEDEDEEVEDQEQEDIPSSSSSESESESDDERSDSESSSSSSSSSSDSESQQPSSDESEKSDDEEEIIDTKKKDHIKNKDKSKVNGKRNGQTKQKSETSPLPSPVSSPQNRNIVVDKPVPKAQGNKKVWYTKVLECRTMVLTCPIQFQPREDVATNYSYYIRCNDYFKEDGTPILSKDFTQLPDLTVIPVVGSRIAFKKHVFIDYNLKLSDYIEGVVENVQGNILSIRVCDEYLQLPSMEYEMFNDNGQMEIGFELLLNPKLIDQQQQQQNIVDDQHEQQRNDKDVQDTIGNGNGNGKANNDAVATKKKKEEESHPKVTKGINTSEFTCVSPDVPQERLPGEKRKRRGGAGTLMSRIVQTLRQQKTDNDKE